MNESWNETLVGPANGLAIALLVWGIAEAGSVRAEVRDKHRTIDAQLDATELNQAVLLERTAPIAPEEDELHQKEDER